MIKVKGNHGNTEKKKTQAKPKVTVSASSAVDPSQAESQKSSMGQARKGLLFIAGVAVVYAAYLVFSGQMDEFLTALAGVSKRWVVAAMLTYVVYYAFGVFAYVLAVLPDKKCPVGVRDLMSVEASGIFFSNLTPNGAGGAPAQIYRLVRAGLSAGGAGALQYTRFIIYEAGEGIFAAIMLLFRWRYFIDTYGNVYLIGVILFGFKIIEVALLLFICLKPNLVIRVCNWIINFVTKRGWSKRTEYWREFANTQVMEFSRGFRGAAANTGAMLLTLVVTLMQLACLYALPWFTLKAFHRPANLITCLACGSMLELLTSAVPLPGGTVGAEGGFAFLFGGMFGSSTSAAYVVWRMVEYLLPILAAAPLLGLRSNHASTLYARWHRLANRTSDNFARLTGKTKRSPRSAGISINPNRIKRKR